jgi:hypothetical protein
MPRLICCITFVGLVTLHPIYGDEPVSGWSQDVLQLFSLSARDEALEKILKQAKYPTNPEYTEQDVGKIKEVVVCPQLDGPPLVTVFARSGCDGNDVSPRSGHFIVIRNDGLILPFSDGANYLDGYFLDLNGDGAIEYVDALLTGSWTDSYGSVTLLKVVPIKEEFRASLVICWKPDVFVWRLHQPDLGLNPTIQIGKGAEKEFELVAEYKWSTQEKCWEGPRGSPDAAFMRVDGDTIEHIKNARKLLNARPEPK